MSIRSGKPFCIAMPDVDHFKRINDDLGHAAGDMVLKGLAGLLQRNSRKEDAACRVGREEFIVIFCVAETSEVARRVDQWRQAFAMMTFQFSDGEIGVTFSAGVASFPEDGASVDALLKAADAALYLAKETGRNRVFTPAHLLLDESLP